MNRGWLMQVITKLDISTHERNLDDLVSNLSGITLTIPRDGYELSICEIGVVPAENSGQGTFRRFGESVTLLPKTYTLRMVVDVFTGEQDERKIMHYISQALPDLVRIYGGIVPVEIKPLKSNFQLVGA